MTEANRRRNLALALEKARQELADGRTLLAAGSYSGAVGHAYYCGFHSARALLLSQEEEPRTHSGLLTRLSLLFIRPGLLAPEVGNHLAVLQAQRQRATYDAAAVFTQAMAEEALNTAENVVEAAEGWLGSQGWI
ncbi:MAG: HEPN domain-containing protein [Vulcanimicrobiota bacterium]